MRFGLTTSVASSVLLVITGFSTLGHAQFDVSAAEARIIAKDAFIYGFPLVDSYRIQYSYFVDRNDPEFKAPWNTINNTARVYTPDDKAIQTPNSDTPYSQLGADLRAEPLVLSVPAVEKGRYYSLQFIDMYTFNFAYVGSRATGSDAGSFLLVGPGWNGEVPKGVKSVIRSETDFAFVLYRTQLFNPGDIDNVKKIQAGYKVQPLSQFLAQARAGVPELLGVCRPPSPRPTPLGKNAAVSAAARFRGECTPEPGVGASSRGFIPVAARRRRYTRLLSQYGVV